MAGDQRAFSLLFSLQHLRGDGVIVINVNRIPRGRPDVLTLSCRNCAEIYSDDVFCHSEHVTQEGYE